MAPSAVVNLGALGMPTGGQNPGRDQFDGSVLPRVHRAFLTPIALDPRFGYFRQPVRHPLSRQDRFEYAFDFFSLFYDVFWAADGEEVIAVGPPAPVALKIPEDLKIRALPSETICKYAYRRSKKPPLPCLLRITPPPGTQALEIQLGDQRWVTPIQPNLTGLFRDRIALVTISRDNHLQWIHDWAVYHASECAVDTVVFYDNDSNNYEMGDVSQALRKVRGLKDVVLVLQDAPFGPVGYPPGGGHSDSAFMKPAMFEHARRRFLENALFYINLDIDELLLPLDIDAFQTILRKDEPVALVDRRDVENYREDGSYDRPRHRHFWWRKQNLSKTLPKWIARPQHCNMNAVFTYHQVEEENSWRVPESDLVIAHFRPITTGWKSPDRLLQVTNKALIEDTSLKERLDRVFGVDSSEVMPWSLEHCENPDLLLRLCYQLADNGDVNKAVTTTLRVLGYDPGRLGALVLLRRLWDELGDQNGVHEASDAIEKVTVLNPDWYLRRATYIRRKSVHAAIAIVKNGIAIEEKSSSLHLMLGALYQKFGNHAAARESFGRVLEIADSTEVDFIKAQEYIQKMELEIENL